VAFISTCRLEQVWHRRSAAELTTRASAFTFARASCFP
jgi:hypothetical protein